MKFNCVGKHPFSSQNDATKVIKRMKRYSKGRSVKRLNAYKCPECNHWHLGSNGHY